MMGLHLKINVKGSVSDKFPLLVSISLGCLLLNSVNNVGGSSKTASKSSPALAKASARDDSSDSETGSSALSGTGSSGSGMISSASKYSYPVYQVPAVASSSFYPSSYSPYSNPYYNYLTGSYYDDRTAREFSARSTTLPMMMAAHSSQVGFQDASPEYASLALASSGGGHGHSGEGHGHSGGHSSGHGHGWPHHGWKKGHTYYENVSKVDTSSLGLLGLLGLLSLLSNVLLLITTTTAAPAGRRRRSAEDSKYLKLAPIAFLEPEVEEDGVSKTERICKLVLPSLNVVAHASYGKIPLNCTHREVCITNRILVNEIGMEGRSVGSTMSSAITKLLKPLDKDGDIGDHVANASLAGRNGQDCESVFPLCHPLNRTVKPLPLLISPTKLYSIARGETTGYI